MHLYLVFALCGFAMTALGALWYGPIFNRQWVSLMNSDKARRFERWANQYPIPFSFVVGTFLNALRIATVHHVLNSLRLLRGGLNQQALITVTMMHVGFSLTSAGGCVWEHRPWRLIAINQGYYAVMTYAGTALMMYLLNGKL
mmetsp:Transcript_4280/g.5517  ORF Transcript_4280/g.5517 Transcript_4280/m.5517 type:complete len:143 (-) Transcript_4280:475-903(-)